MCAYIKTKVVHLNYGQFLCPLNLNTSQEEKQLRNLDPACNWNEVGIPMDWKKKLSSYRNMSEKEVGPALRTTITGQRRVKKPARPHYPASQNTSGLPKMCTVWVQAHCSQPLVPVLCIKEPLFCPLFPTPHKPRLKYIFELKPMASKCNVVFSPFTGESRESTVPGEGWGGRGCGGVVLQPQDWLPKAATNSFPQPLTQSESYSQVVVMATKRQPRAGGSYHPTSGASSLPSHHSSHLTNCVIKRAQIVINYKVCLHDSKFGHARITLRMRKKPVVVVRSKISDWDAREDATERDSGRKNAGGHVPQCPCCSPLSEHSNEKSCTVTSDCPFQIPRMKQYESAMSPGV